MKIRLDGPVDQLERVRVMLGPCPKDKAGAEGFIEEGGAIVRVSKEEARQVIANANPLMRIAVERSSDLDGAWSEGYDAEQLGVGEDANPYPNGSVEHEAWSDGWEDGRIDETK